MPKNRLTVRVGSSFADSGGEVFEVEQVIKHHFYNPKTINFDFAILKVKGSIKLEKKVKEIIALPSLYNDKVVDNTETFVSGFGLSLDNAVNSDNVLRGVVVPVIAKEVCRRSYPLLITDQMLCAGLSAGGKDSCSG